MYTLCGNEECPIKEDCLRWDKYTKLGTTKDQSFLAEPQKECVDNNFMLFVDKN